MHAPWHRRRYMRTGPTPSRARRHSVMHSPIAPSRARNGEEGATRRQNLMDGRIHECISEARAPLLFSRERTQRGGEVEFFWDYFAERSAAQPAPASGDPTL